MSVEALTLAAESKAVARKRIMDATVELLAERGWATTTDDVAARARVGRRTVFRYFPTHGQLMAAAYDQVWRGYVDNLPSALPDGEVDVKTWLLETTIAIHRLNSALGAAWWGLHTPLPAPSPELAAWREEWLKSRPGVATEFTNAVWRAEGGKGAAPAWVHEAFHLQMGAFVSNALSVERPRPPEETGALSTRILLAVLATALAEAKTEGTRKPH
jgi:AcrR family transcriptional regulator